VRSATSEKKRGAPRYFCTSSALTTGGAVSPSVIRTRNLEAYARDLALEISQPRLARVAVDYLAQRVLGEFDFLIAESVLDELLWDQVALHDLQLFFFGVSGSSSTSILSRSACGTGSSMLAVVRNNTFRKIERDVQVMVGEGVVLLGIEHLEQRRRRIAAEIHAELVDFVEDEQRVVRARIAQSLDDSTRQRADVSAAMPANLGLVADAAERQAHEFAAECSSDRLAERSFAGARRTDEAQDRSLGVVLSLRTARNSRMRSLIFSRS